MEIEEQVLSAWDINARLNLFLLHAIPEDHLHTQLAKGKSVQKQFAHMHNVRLMWIKVADAGLYETLSKLEDDCSRGAIHKALEVSAEAIRKIVKVALESGRSVKNFKPNAPAFVAYLTAHEANHRGHIELALRQAGVPLSDKVAYGLWEWGVR